MKPEERRLVDYFVVAGYDHKSKKNRGRSGGGGGNGDSGFHCKGTVLQRFPMRDWADTPFTEGLEHFCQPNGWLLQSEPSEPKFFIAGLTDINGGRQYCAVLTFSEAIAKEDLELEQERRLADEEEDDPGSEALSSIVSSIARGRNTSLPRHIVPGVSLPTLSHDSLLFAPKCLVLVSKYDYPETLKNCLSTIYTVYNECMVGQGGERIRLENIIGNLLGSVYVPPPNGPQVRFSLGAGDRIIFQPSIYEHVPNTGTRVALLFKQLGIKNVLDLFCATMTELKILFVSQSFMRLFDACSALTALMYPLKYSHVLIPILPSSLLEVLATPTPFIIGVNSVHESEIADLLDVVKVDLDGGAITIPENMTINKVPDPMLSRVQNELMQVLQPELSLADHAFPSPSETTVPSKKPLASLDKELRAVMLRLMVQIFEGYRACLTLVRIHPSPYITFHKAAFLGLRSLSDSEFMRRLMHCMYLGTFISDRGPPWRVCDIFDKLCCNFADQFHLEQQDPTKALVHVRNLAEELYRNENPLATLNHQPFNQKVPSPAEGAMKRIHQPVFPHLEEELVAQIIYQGLDRFREEQSGGSNAPLTMQLVPSNTKISSSFGNDNGRSLMLHSARKLGVLRNCIASIFEGKISDAKKTFPAVISALKTKQARLALCEELSARRGDRNQVLLEHQQFDMIVRLMNAALQDDSDMDEHGIALAILPLACAFGRKLSKGVIQFAYTLIQGHAVWQNQQFWEASFYNDVQTGIKTLYMGMRDQNSNSPPTARSSVTSMESANFERSILELTADEIRNWDNLDDAKKHERTEAEEKTVYSQVLAYINNMIYLMCPMEIAAQKKNGRRPGDDYENASNSISNSMAESDSIDAESGFEDQEIPDSGQQVIKNVMRFADKVCSESHVSEESIKKISAMIPTTVAMHLEVLEAVATQASRLPLIQKPKITSPALLPGEELVFHKGLRVYLLPDGRTDEGSATNLLPAEGALFLTNYRLIFKGTPIDPFAAENVVTRFFPVSSLTKEKRFVVNEYLTEIEQQLKEGIQLRSNTFQLIRAAFDDEVTPEEIDNFRKSIQRTQYPGSIIQSFAFRGYHFFSQGMLSKGKEKNAKYSTIRGFANKTLKNVSKVAGYQPKKRKSSKYLTSVMPTPGRLSIAEMSLYNDGSSGKIREEDEFNEVVEAPSKPLSINNGTKSLERLSEKSYFKDWIRQGLISPDYNINYKGQHHSNESFRVSTVNNRYAVAETYPALLLVPSRINDDSLKRYSRHHKHSRFPTITWRHPKTKALLLRGSGFHNRGMFGMIRRHQDGHASMSGTQTDMASSAEVKGFINSIVQVTPRALIKPDSSWSMSGSELSLNTLGISADSPSSNVHNYPTLTPNMARKMNPLTKAMDTLTRGTAAPKMSRMSLSSLKGNKTMGSQGSLIAVASSSFGFQRSSYRQSDSESSSDIGIHSFLQKTSLYLFGDRNQIKGVKLESLPKTEIIPVEYPEPRRVRASFKKLMRACVPSTKSTQPDNTFLKMVEASEWLQMLENIINTSNAVVNLLDIQAASVSLCLEDGWDVTCQISSLAMVCLDPFYRTIEGFRVLVEKEWMSLGHRFNHRSCLSNPTQDPGFTPVFLQFLDAVHQILVQYPTAFEFNNFYLKFLAYHHTSCRFRTFLADNELQANEIALFASDDKSSSISRGGMRTTDSPSSDEETLPTPTMPSPKGNVGVNIFDYIEYHASLSPVFHNFDFDPSGDETVLRPASNISELVIWSFYYGEELKHGAPYDFEVYTLDVLKEEEYNSPDSLTTHSGRQNLVMGYNCLSKSSIDIFTDLLNEASDLESSLGHVQKDWQHIWDQIEPLPPVPPRRTSSLALIGTNPYSKLQHRSIHKRRTMELILKGKMGAQASSAIASAEGGVRATSFMNTHRFEKYNSSSLTSCEVCNSVLWGPVRTGMKCQDCGYSCHEKCCVNVTRACTRIKTSSSAMPREQPTDPFHGSSHHSTTYETDHPTMASGGAETDDDDLYKQYSVAGVDENSQIIYQGNLYKQANFKIKGWKERWFVLDATKHQLRYYDFRDDFQCRGLIDLSEVTRVAQGTSAPAMSAGAPKKAEDGCFFDLVTHKRTYCFCAEKKNEAEDWVRKIQSCLSS